MLCLQATGAWHLAGVPASTHNPQVVRDTMLHGWGNRDLARLAIQMGGEDIHLPNHIAVSAETTLPTGIDPAAWFMPMAAVGAGLAGVVLVLEGDADTL